MGLGDFFGSIISAPIDLIFEGGEAIINHVHWTSTGNVGSATPEQWQEQAKHNPKEAARNLFNTTQDPANWASALAELESPDREAVAAYLRR